MIATTPDAIYDEIEDARKHAAKFHNFADERVRRYAAGRYRSDWLPTQGPVYKPHEWEYVTNMVPNLVYKNPGVEVEGLLEGVDDEPAYAIRQVLPQWLHGVRFAERLIPLAYDTMFSFGVAALRLDALPGYNGSTEPVPLWPVFERISPHRFFQDPRGGASAWRYRGHYWRSDQQDLLQATGPDGAPLFDPDAVGSLTTDSDDREYDGDQQGPKGWTAQRKVVTGYEFYHRESGIIYTLGSLASGRRVFLRPPRPFIGFPDDPYVLFGLYLVPDQVYPLAPLAVTDEKAREINAHRQAAAADAATLKRLLLYDIAQPGVGEKIATAASGTALGLPGVGAGMFQTVEFGGNASGQLDYIDRLSMELNEMSGMTDLRRGNITGRATATEVAEVAEADDARTEFARATFHACAVELLDKAARLMLRSNQVVVPIVVEAVHPQTGQPVKIPRMYVGGSLPAQNAAGRIRLKIEPYSMERVSRQSIQRRAQLLGGLVLQSIPLAMQNPLFPWQSFFDDQGEAMNMKDLGKKYFSWVPMMAAIQASAAQQQQQPGAAEKEPGGGGGGGGGGEANEGGSAPDLAALAAAV